MNGRSKETLVFLHGFGGGSSAYKWSKVYPAFALSQSNLGTRFDWLGAIGLIRQILPSLE